MPYQPRKHLLQHLATIVAILSLWGATAGAMSSSSDHNAAERMARARQQLQNARIERAIARKQAVFAERQGDPRGFLAQLFEPAPAERLARAEAAVAAAEERLAITREWVAALETPPAAPELMQAPDRKAEADDMATPAEAQDGPSEAEKLGEALLRAYHDYTNAQLDQEKAKRLARVNGSLVKILEPRVEGALRDARQQTEKVVELRKTYEKQLIAEAEAAADEPPAPAETEPPAEGEEAEPEVPESVKLRNQLQEAQTTLRELEDEAVRLQRQLSSAERRHEANKLKAERLVDRLAQLRKTLKERERAYKPYGTLNDLRWPDGKPEVGTALPEKDDNA